MLTFVILWIVFCGLMMIRRKNKKRFYVKPKEEVIKIKTHFQFRYKDTNFSEYRSANPDYPAVMRVHNVQHGFYIQIHCKDITFSEFFKEIPKFRIEKDEDSIFLYTEGTSFPIRSKPNMSEQNTPMVIYFEDEMSETPLYKAMRENE